MKLVKLETGGVQLINDDGKIIRSFPGVAYLEISDNLVALNIEGHKVNLFPSSITETQILPAAPVAFSGDAYDLGLLLSSGFFGDALGGGGGQIIIDSTPPSNESKLWLNDADSLIYFYNGEYWITSQIFQLEFNEPGRTNNNTFFRYGSLATNVSRGAPCQDNALFISAAFKRGNTSNGRIAIYVSRSSPLAFESFSFDISGQDEGVSLVDLGVPEVLGGSFLAPRWIGGNTSNFALILNYRKVYVP
jgi:hypothetical protein